MCIGPNEDGAELYRKYLEGLPCPSCAAKYARIALLEKVAEAAKEYDEARGLFHEADWKGMIESNNELFNECEMDRGIDPFYKVRAALDALKEG